LLFVEEFFGGRKKMREGVRHVQAGRLSEVLG
jgi:hypothetical protein